MSERAQVHILLHGGILLFLGFLCGFPLYLAMTENWGDAPVHEWRVAHAGLLAGGVLLIATGAALRHFLLSGRNTSILVWSLVLANYGFILNGIAGGVTAANWLAFGSLVAAALGSVVGSVLMIVGAYTGLRRIPAP